MWIAIAHDLLPVMASSVSSERAFSTADITIMKRRNRLHGDIVEALQVLKVAFWCMGTMKDVEIFEGMEDEEEKDVAGEAEKLEIELPKSVEDSCLLLDLGSDCEESDA
ncbi:hypothetical protein E1B28_003186 [Marasmius oreades]|uniref:HAT C-terminal dimerisation domain-containing protein n=1 Tax=Marasmius oreades TaxID=181124 RepID=A0A9P7UN62_9AGAR|nr:uncharacterized protein E1B28_003186 [Marasmius oreades]KAG7085639.1 hypothetical protein E1B28_003186 [Marasmius oreades]